MIVTPHDLLAQREILLAQQSRVCAASAQWEPQLQAVLKLSRRYNYERKHTHQVTRLALRLFDELWPLHRLSAQERFWLQCAAVLHDIGRCEDREHHKVALRIVLSSALLPFDKMTRRIIGSIARYHTKAPPNKKHGHYSALPESKQQVVRKLAAILRLGDALDRSHTKLVKRLWCDVTDDCIAVRCVTRDESRDAALCERANQKGRLLVDVFKRKLVIKTTTVKNLRRDGMLHLCRAIDSGALRFGVA